MSFFNILRSGILLFMLLAACKEKPAEDKTAVAPDAPVVSIVPVKIAEVTSGPVRSTIELNASTSFLKKNEVRSTAVGYISRVNVQLGDKVNSGQILFQLKTKEAKALGENLFPNDTSLRFSGLIPVKASQSGFVTSINHQNGDYVQEGDSMCTIADLNSLAFIVNVPFELNQSVKSGMSCEIILPDGRHLQGVISKKLAIMDQASQTESYVIKATLNSPIPENLIAKVQISRIVKQVSILVPKEALLSNEEQNQFWVMLVKDHKTAIRMDVQKGLETNGKVEIMGSQLKTGDKVLVSGNYGLTDTASIKIIK